MQLPTVLFGVSIFAAVVRAASVLYLRPVALQNLDLLTHDSIRPTGSDQDWWIGGYGNPNCTGPQIWVKKGTSHSCNFGEMAELAVSYTWIVNKPATILSWVGDADSCLD